MRAKLEAMLEAGQDNALLRFSLGEACLREQDAAAAVGHLAQAVALDPGYSAAWKRYGQALAETGDKNGARAAYTRGIEVAGARGDQQAAKEMQVFLKRLTR